MAGINFTDGQEYAPKLSFKNNEVLPLVSGSYSAPFCKACKYWTVIDVLGGEYCTLIKECVASPMPEYKHKDCPL